MNVNWNDAAIIARVRAAALIGVTRAGNKVHERAVQRIMQGPKTGRTYTRRGVKHKASAPGESPASDRGGLAGAGTVDAMPGVIGVRVVFRKIYARPLELGSAYKIGGSGGAEGQHTDPAQREMGTQTLEPRPFLRPALEEMREIGLAIIIDEIRKALGLSGGQTVTSPQLELF